MSAVPTLVLFFDGIGVGENDPETNPFADGAFRRLAAAGGRLSDPEGSYRPLDATLGVPGLPQSATGQTTLLTGENAARLAGGHLPGLPGPTLLPLLERRSLFVRMRREGLRPTFANAYTRAHLEAPRPRWSATTRMVKASGVPFRMLDDEGARGRALLHDYTGAWARRRGVAAPAHDAASAARVLVDLLDDHDLVLYEYFLTDVVAHRGTREQQRTEARRAEDLVDAVLAAADLRRSRIVVVSDHGNLEDNRHRLHTRNPVPLLAWGAQADTLVASIADLTGLTPALLRLPGSTATSE